MNQTQTQLPPLDEDTFQSFYAQDLNWDVLWNAVKPFDKNSWKKDTPNSPLKYKLPFITMIEDIPDVKGLIHQVAHVGSTYICDPPPLDTDIDNLVLMESQLTPEEFKVVEKALIEHGWKKDGDYIDIGAFSSFKKDKFNVIITLDKEFFTHFCEASALCRDLNIMDKFARIAIHDYIINGNTHHINYGFYNKFLHT